MFEGAGDTIVAIASPPGRGAVSLIRISGSEAEALVQPHLRAGRALKSAPRCPLLGKLSDPQGQPLDQVLVTFFPAPASYTGEDVVEISCHGSLPVVRAIVETVLSRGGRLAGPGEFTLRAFLNGKLDLSQAEAVRDLISSQTAFQARVAREQLEGALSRELKPLRDDLVKIISHLETALEFVEDDVSPTGRVELMEVWERVIGRLRGLESDFALGRIIHDGAVITIVGKPNAGKSSLFNALLNEDRAIVTPIPGTTRDALSEWINLSGIPARLVDTAGIREARDHLERLGVQKSLDYLGRSDAVCFVLDGATPFDDDDWRIWELVREGPCILAVNKADLPARVVIPEAVDKECAGKVWVSALQGVNLEELRSLLLHAMARREGLEEERVMVTDVRHQRCIARAREGVEKGLEAARAGLSEEFALYDLRKALDTLGEITGETPVEDILAEIFATFCIGK